MRITLKFLTIMMSVALAVTVAQGPRNNQGQGQGQGNQNVDCTGQPQLDMTTVMDVTGAINLVNVGYGNEDPSIEVDGKLIRLAPAWFLEEAGFDLSGVVAVQYVRGAGDNASRLYAIDIAHEVGDQLQLRDPATGQPLWIGGRGQGARAGNGAGGQGAAGQGNGGQGNRGVNSNAGSCLDMASQQTVTGTVLSIVNAAGIRQTRLEVAPDAGGDAILIQVGPPRLLAAAGVTPAAGLHLRIDYVTDTCTESKVAVALTLDDGVTIQIRDQYGRPVW